eukprot:TRINITY_DN2887_c0_g1_i1.p1 TRINITY_DN2887_c0_g1~~TRINITY_DN2887_c0_g1_i1.p1  ORF type:complete len:270 (-),score=45.00 TRINITY_DN2887_c0_g1_i1:111-920(-)
MEHPSKIVVYVRGGGEIASAVIHRLRKCGFSVVCSEIAKPLAVRRQVSFCEVVLGKTAEVEGVKGTFAETFDDVTSAWKMGQVPVIVDPNMEMLSVIKPDFVVDCILAKKNLGTKLKQGSRGVIALGPGFQVGRDCDVIIETNRGHHLGRVFSKIGEEAAPNTGIPGAIMGVSADRVLRAPVSGTICHVKNIGDMVEKDEVICTVDGHKVRSLISGIIRGLIMNGAIVKEKLKIGDVDPRGDSTAVHTISDKSRNISGGVLQAILERML